MILPQRCAATRCRNLAETAKKMGCWSLDVVTAHIIEFRAGDWKAVPCLARPLRTCTYHPAGRTNCSASRTSAGTYCYLTHATGVIT